MSPVLKIENLANRSVSISILTATYNAEKHLPRLIQSLRDQSDPDFQWVVIDGGSKDDTLAQLENADEIVNHLTSEPDFGIYHALNKAVAVATGTYYLVMGADDQLHPRAVENFRKEAAASGADVISAPVLANGIEVAPRRKMTWWRSAPPFVSSHSVGALIRTALHKDLGLYSRRFPIAADTYFFLCAWKLGKVFHYFDRPVGIYGTSGFSGQDRLGALCDSFRANAEVRGNLIIHSLLLALRIIKNWRTIHEELGHVRK